MKKLFNVLFCMLLVFSLFGCSDENKQIEEKILKQNYCVDVCETAISLKTFYEGISSRSIRYDDDSESLIAFQDENLLEDVWVDPVNKKVLGNYGDIVISDWMVDKLCEVFNKDLKSIGITTDQLVEYMQYKMENDPNGKVSNDESRIKKEDYPEPIVSETQK